MVGQRSDTKPSWIKLPNDLVNECERFAADVVAGYARGDNPNSHAYSYRDADKNSKLWCAAKMAECIFALEHALDPRLALNWSGKPDWFDIVLHGKRIEIRSSHPRAAYLIWPVAKNKLFKEANCDVLVLTKISRQYEVGYSDGWITKLEFANQYQVAGPDHKLDEGTWYVDRASLHPMSELIQ